MGELSRRLFLTAAIPLIATASRSAVWAAETTGPVPPKRVALSGYDPVSYFTEGHPEKGASDFTFAFDDAIYWFKNAEHHAMFAADPEHYAPQYAGYCTITVSRGGKFEADPEAWKVWDGKLFVFGSKNGVSMFGEDGPAIVAKADANWPTVRDAR
jgi:hypothetical protein